MIFSRERTAKSPLATRPLVLFMTHQYLPNVGDAELFTLASEAGFRPFVVPWFSVNVRDGNTHVGGGYELLPDGSKRPVVSWEHVFPDLIFHRMNMSVQQEELFNRLARANPDAVLSYHPELGFLNSRWGAELCLREGEKKGIALARPETFLIPDEISPRLQKAGELGPLVFKHFDVSQGHGIAVSSPETFQAALEEGLDGSPAQFVVQRMVENEVEVDRKRCELQVYAYVESFRPLSYTVYADAFVRLVAPPPKLKRGRAPLSTLMNRLWEGEGHRRDQRLTVTQALEKLRAKGLRVEGFWERVDAMAKRLFECFADWKPLASAPNLHRLILLTGLDAMLVAGPEGVEPLFVGSHQTPLLHGFGPPEVDEKLLHVTRQWLARLLERCRRPQSILLPSPDFERAWPAITGTVRELGRANGEPITFEGAAEVLNHVEGRQRLVEEVGAHLSDGQSVALGASGERLRGLQLLISRHGGSAAMDIAVEDDADLRDLHVPLAGVFPTVGLDYCLVDTQPWPDAQFEYLHSGLIGPRVGADAATREESLLRYLGRVISPEPTADPLGKRFVEPGVGRTTLVDFLRVEGRQEFTDFSVLGVGLTPYSAGGYAMVGPYVDGKTSVNRAVHRFGCSERLEEAGCRVAKTLAIIRLPGLETTMPDETKAPAALIVRGFRSILRVKQLDPLASLFLSVQHRPQLLSFLLDPRWEVAQQPGPNAARTTTSNAASPRNLDLDFLQALYRFGGTTTCMRRITGERDGRAGSSYSERRAKERRLQVIYSYAPILLNIAKAKLARELGRDPELEPLSDQEYIYWFARTLGRQLALMKKVRFLHDYHQQGISRYTPNWIYTLCETNVTLLAEFPDLDTGVFTDRLDTRTLEELLISKEEFRTLQAGYESFHARDVSEARAVLRTLTLITFHGNVAREAWAAEQFTRGYEEGLSWPLAPPAKSNSHKPKRSRGAALTAIRRKPRRASPIFK